MRRCYAGDGEGAFGDEIASELVQWFNEVDATYRTELRDLNELNFARFDARLEQRIAEADARFAQRLAELEIKLERRMAEFEVKVEHRLAEFRAEMHAGFAAIRVELAVQQRDTLRWLFIFWAGTIIPLAGLIIALDRF